METAATVVMRNTCRACSAQCPVDVAIVDGKTASLKPVKDHPVYHGYACARGRASPEFAYLPGRLKSSLRRKSDGSFEPIASDTAIREVAAIIKQTVEKHGPRSVALYHGTMGLVNATTVAFADALMAAIGSPMVCNTAPIDQPGKFIALAIHGMWLAGHANPDQADAWLAIGTNPAISMMFPPNPAHVVSRAKRRGARIYVIDPRRTELAQHADIFLQARPGQDAIILAGLINVILRENLQDQAFLDANACGVDNLKHAVGRFTPEFVSQRAGVPIEAILQMARGYATSKSAIAFAGTGPNMSEHGTLMEYLRMALMTICGHWRKEGDPISYHGVCVHTPPPIAQATVPTPGWHLGEKLRVRNLTNTANGMPTTALAEEILLDGDGQVRILIVNGGNPMVAWPDQLRTREAMKKLDLLVCLDPTMSDTAKYAHYVIAPRIQFETTNTTAGLEMVLAGYPMYHNIEAYGSYSPALVKPPLGSDLIDDWEFYFGVAREMGLPLKLKPLSYVYDPLEAEKRAMVLDTSTKPTSDEVWNMLLAGSPVPLETIKANQDKVFEPIVKTVQPKAQGWMGKLDVGNRDMMEDLDRAYSGPSFEDVEGFTHRLICRRLKDRWNSVWREHDVTTRHWLYNPAFMNPQDMSQLGLEAGDLIEIRSQRGAIKGVVEPDHTVLEGIISMSHAWGGDPDDKRDPREIGANTSMLTDTTVDFDPYSAMPRMSNIPVAVRLIEKRAV